MSEFQLGLLIIGVTVVIAVMAFNKWQEIRYRRLAEMSLKSGHADVLLDADKPAGAAAVFPDLVQENSDIPDPDVETERVGSAGNPGQEVASQADSSNLSRAINLVASIEVPSGVTVNELLPTGLNGEIGRRISLEVFSDGRWAPPVENARFTRLNLALQLVNRKGPVSEKDLESFAAWISEAALRSGAVVAPLDLGAALQDAVSLDKFCGEVDLQIAVHVVAGNSPFPGTKIRALAEAAGLAMEPDGKFRKRDEGGRELFRLANESDPAFQPELMRDLTTASVILEFDVARCPGGNHAFAKFRQFSEHLASGLGGRIVDDNRTALDRAGFDAIAKELGTTYQAMATRRILPGSPDALRLFS